MKKLKLYQLTCVGFAAAFYIHNSDVERRGAGMLLQHGRPITERYIHVRTRISSKLLVVTFHV